MSLSKRSKKRAILKRSRKREERGAEEVGGRRCSQSGGGITKGDFRNEEWCCEDKFTVAGKQYTLKESTILKALGEAHRTGRNPVIKIGYRKVEVAVLMWDDFMELIDDEGITDDI